ncbi:tyrosine-type recombinase/integrase [Campylobacter sp. RM12642]|uniref:tyrosine-type recombinase/integrase n=1 Tax=unclassified Campylobacter TaxID=2593542 RepID=UPI003014FA89|nr:tyrosine-type recombinase/integrase [Campylobacter sp. RM12654]MBZ7980873.1 tyrosine-type recombinase/integrase [Campylobacter sp. RM12642]
MGRISSTNLTNKDIKKLQNNNKAYIKCVGNPKELYLRIYPSGMKTFCIRYKNKMIKLHEFRENIYSIKEARADAIKILRKLLIDENYNLSINRVNYNFSILYKQYIKIVQNKCRNERYVKQIMQRINKYLLPKLGDKNIADIKHSELLDILTSIYNPANKNKSRIDIIHRLISYLKSIFDLAIADNYIQNNPANNLKEHFITLKEFNKINSRDGRRPALINNEDIKNFIKCLKENNKIDLNIKYAIFLQILTANRPFNTVSAKWSYIDFKNKLWTIPASEMKNKNEHTIALNTYMIKILSELKSISKNNIYVFPSKYKNKHISTNTISKAIRETLNYKYYGKVVPYGFRSTFKTICSLNITTLNSMGISEKVIEEVMDHSTKGIAMHYERSRSSIKEKMILMQWYGDYINNIEKLL